MIPFDLLETFEWIPPGHFVLETLEANRFKRMLNLSDIPNAQGMCCWCNTKKLEGRRRRWCSEACEMSAVRYCHPQTPSVKAWILIHRQGCSCSACGLDYTDVLKEKVERWSEHLKRMQELSPQFYVGREKVSYHLLGSNTGDLWHVDHVVPIHKGGDGIGFHNIQVICVSCHLKKTIAERSHSNL